MTDYFRLLRSIRPSEGMLRVLLAHALKALWHSEATFASALMFWGFTGLNHYDERRSLPLFSRWLCGIGLACNAVVTILNGGHMPTKAPWSMGIWRGTDYAGPKRLAWLGDNYRVPLLIRTAWVSIGDLFIFAGLLNVFLPKLWSVLGTIRRRRAIPMTPICPEQGPEEL